MNHTVERDSRKAATGAVFGHVEALRAGYREKVKPGQFVVLRADDRAERIPLTVADFDREKGQITVIFQEVGASTKKLAQFDSVSRSSTWSGRSARQAI